MNIVHHWLCSSGRWRRALEQQLVPWVLDGIVTGDSLLELGPGPGLTTDLLRSRVARLMAVEIDDGLARRLARRTANSNVRVIHGDAASLPFPDGTFSSAVSFTMLHHVPTAELQDRIFREARRVLRPGGVFCGTDGRAGFAMTLLHIADTLTPIDPHTLAERLRTAGFTQIDIDVRPARFRFRAS